jgi:DNA invertase Pin-like site-specific DNA recombinase
MNTAIYARTSTNNQQKGLESQVRALESYCKSKDITDYNLYQDSGVSGSKSSRPELDALMEAVKAKKVDTVIVYSFSRFSRSTKHLLDTLELFNLLGVTFISISENLDTRTAMGKAVFTIISSLSQLERELISERVKNGLENARAKGKKIGRNKVRNSDLIRSLRDQSMSYREIARLTGYSISTISREFS